MVSKLFLDANILLDFILKPTTYLYAEAIIRQAVDAKIELLTAPAVIHVTSY